MGPCRRTIRHRAVLLVALPFVVGAFLPTPSAQADEGAPTPPASESLTQGPDPTADPTSPPQSTEPGSPEEASTDEVAPAPAAAATSPTAAPSPTDGPASPDAPDADPETSEPPDTSPATTAAPSPAVASSPTAARPRGARAAEPKVTICHRTNSRTNPYNQIAVAESAAVSGHAGHTGPIFAPGVDDWGDIIPPIRPGLPDGLNWPEGRSYLDNGCEAPPPPDVGPLPSASIGEVACVGSEATVDVTVSNGADATAPARFTIRVDGVVVETVGPLAPGESETVTLVGDTGGGLEGAENQTVTIEVRSGGEVIASQVITVDCAPGPPQVGIDARMTCVGDQAQGTLTVTNNGQVPVEVTATVDGTPVGTALVVGPGATVTGTADLSAYEDQTVTVGILVDGAVAATYTVTPDCVSPQSDPRVSVAGQECPPPSATVTLANDGDPASQVVFVIRVNGRVVQKTAPVFGGNATTIVGDLSRYEDRTIVVAVRANGELLGRRTIKVNCEQSSSGPATAPNAGSTQPGTTTTTPGVLPSVGAEFSPGLLALGLGLVGAGSLLVASGPTRWRRPRR